MPVISTVHGILVRHGAVSAAASAAAKPWQRFEPPTPTICSRCPDAGTLSSVDRAGRPFVHQRLIAAFERYGLPARMTMDNGSPWGKDERFHRTLKPEVLQGPPWAVLDKAQRALDHWRQRYDAQRPHQALGMQEWRVGKAFIASPC